MSRYEQMINDKHILKPNEIYNLSDNFENSFFGIDNSYKLCLVLKSNKSAPQSIQTSKLELELNYQYFSEEGNSNYYNVIKVKSNDKNELEAFMKLCEVFLNTNNYNITSEEVYNLFIQLKDMFRNENKLKEKDIVGLFGELLFLNFFYQEYNINLVDQYRYNESQKYDFNISPNLKIEVKSTTDKSRIHYVEHEQIFSGKNVFLVSAKLKYDESGISLKELFDSNEQLFNKDYRKKMEMLKKINSNKSLSDQMRFNFENSIDDLKVYFNKNIDTIGFDYPKYIERIKYTMNFDGIKDETFDLLYKSLKKDVSPS